MTPSTKHRKNSNDDLLEKIHNLETSVALHDQIITKLDLNLEKLQILTESTNKLLVMHTSWADEKIKNLDNIDAHLEAEIARMSENHSSSLPSPTSGFSNFLTMLLNWRYLFYGIIFVLGLMSGRLRLIENMFNQ